MMLNYITLLKYSVRNVLRRPGLIYWEQLSDAVMYCHQLPRKVVDKITNILIYNGVANTSF